MDTPIDERFPEPSYWQAFLERRAAGDYDLARLGRPDSLGTLYDASSDAFCAPEGMRNVEGLRIPVTDGDLPRVTWRPVSGKALPPQTPTLTEPPDAHPIAFWFGLLNGPTLAAILGTLLGIFFLLALLFGAGHTPGGN